MEGWWDGIDVFTGEGWLILIGLLLLLLGLAAGYFWGESVERKRWEHRLPGYMPPGSRPGP